MSLSSIEMTAEHTIPKLDRKGLRQFGFVTGAVVAAVFGLFFPWVLGRGWPLWPWFIAGPLWALAVVSPLWLQPIYRGWMRFGLLASRVTTPVILGVVFFVMISPLALFRRLRGRDPMNREYGPMLESYRVPSTKHPLKNLERPF
jgi:hypothetical protein